MMRSEVVVVYNTVLTVNLCFSCLMPPCFPHPVRPCGPNEDSNDCHNATQKCDSREHCSGDEEMLPYTDLLTPPPAILAISIEACARVVVVGIRRATEQAGVVSEWTAVGGALVETIGERRRYWRRVDCLRGPVRTCECDEDADEGGESESEEEEGLQHGKRR